MSTPPLVALDQVSRHFGRKEALHRVSLQLTPGFVLGLVGANGAGKTTLIKHILGLLRPHEGRVRVFGLNPVDRPAEVMARLGYLSEDRDLPPWMTVNELLRYTRAFYPDWDTAYAESLRTRFQLPTNARIRTLSKGELAKAGLLVALAHRPELLVLDEPSSGLDPVVRRELLETVVRAVASEGRTVLFSSHLLDEIARVSDHVAMMSAGRLVLSGPLPTVIEAHRRVVIRLPAGAGDPGRFPGALGASGEGGEWTVICNGAMAEFQSAVRAARGDLLEETEASFEEIFHARAGRPPED